MQTVTLTIDGRQITVAKGTTVLQAAIENGIRVPYYCYHPGIGVDGSCRVCVVKVEKMPKLQTSCSTICADGMVVHTGTEDVAAARAGVFEFLLINHPLDCPVCDKGGECPLQDFSYAFGPDHSRMEFPRREFDGAGVKADVDFGPTLMLNRNRCILCTRCVRFMRDVDGDAQINIVDRGCGSEIATFQEEGVHSLLSGNLVDVCPVGAITTRDYRFKSRPWDNPTAADTICTMCSKGCNTTAWVKAKPEWAKGSQLIRFTPRFNPKVNGYWMCDIGRFDYHWIEESSRLSQPLCRDGNGRQAPVSWPEAMATLGARLTAPGVGPAGLRFLLSAHASHEELFLVRRLAEELVAGGRIAVEQPARNAASGTEPAAVGLIAVGWRVNPKSQSEHSRFRVPDVDAPNVNGARLLGLISGSVGDAQGSPDVSKLRRDVEAARVSALYVFDSGPEGSIGNTKWIVGARTSGALPFLVVHGVLFGDLARAADVVLPGASYVEKEASYTNDQGRLQGTARAIAAPGDAREDWQVLVAVSRALGARIEYASGADLRADIAARFGHVDGFRDITTLAFSGPVGARHWLHASNPSERWKWDFMYQDLPPTKFSGEPFSTNFAGVIPLKEVK